MRKINNLVVHCSATPPSIDRGVEWIRTIHVRDFGWSDVGYHYVIRRDGRIENGRPEERIGAHVRGKNKDSLGVCLIGGVDENGKAEANYTDAQYKSLRKLLDSLKLKYPNAKILGHRDLSPDMDGDGVIESHEWVKECPSFDVRKWLKHSYVTNKTTGELLGESKRVKGAAVGSAGLIPAVLAQIDNIKMLVDGVKSLTPLQYANMIGLIVTFCAIGWIVYTKVLDGDTKNVNINKN